MPGLDDLRDWFTDDELVSCPRCGEHAAIPMPRRSYFICLDCGLVHADGRRIRDVAGESAGLNDTD